MLKPACRYAGMESAASDVDYLATVDLHPFGSDSSSSCYSARSKL